MSLHDAGLRQEFACKSVNTLCILMEFVTAFDCSNDSPTQLSKRFMSHYLEQEYCIPPLGQQLSVSYTRKMQPRSRNDKGHRLHIMTYHTDYVNVLTNLIKLWKKKQKKVLKWTNIRTVMLIKWWVFLYVWIPNTFTNTLDTT